MSKEPIVRANPQTAEDKHPKHYLADWWIYAVLAFFVGGLIFMTYALTLRELWGTSDTYRADGVWGRKRVARLFRARPDHRFDERPLHASKAPLQGRVFGRFPPADLVVYHLRMIRPEDRIARRDRYLALDPQARWQPGIGYDYLTDERGAVLRRVPRRRDWRD